MRRTILKVIKEVFAGKKDKSSSVWSIDEALDTFWAAIEMEQGDKAVKVIELIGHSATAEDLPQLKRALLAKKGDWWTREKLAEIMVRLNGVEYLAELINAYEQNLADGHDNDGFTAALINLIEEHPQIFRAKLEAFLQNPEYQYRETATWLLSFCD